MVNDFGLNFCNFLFFLYRVASIFGYLVSYCFLTTFLISFTVPDSFSYGYLELLLYKSFISTFPVSYTHLDVYKRQLRGSRGTLSHLSSGNIELSQPSSPIPPKEEVIPAHYRFDGRRPQKLWWNEQVQSPKQGKITMTTRTSPRNVLLRCPVYFRYHLI